MLHKSESWGCPRTPRSSRGAIIVFMLTLATCACIALILLCGLGDEPHHSLGICKTAALKGDAKGPMQAIEIPKLEYATLESLPVPEGVKNAQAASMFGRFNYRTLALQGSDLLLVPLCAFRHIGYSCIRVYVENKSHQSIELVTEVCQLHTNGVSRASASTDGDAGTSGESEAVRAVVVGFDLESESYLILDNGDGPRVDSGGLFLSRDAVQAHSVLGCEPYSRFKNIVVRKGYPTIEIPEGKFAIVTLCYAKDIESTGIFDILLRSRPAQTREGFRITVEE